jgi:putative DNA methylase
MPQSLLEKLKRPLMTAYRKKLIEVALPLDDINRESAREKSIRHGHPSTLHLWWARRPLAACRAVLFASLVDDPSAHPDRFPTEQAQQAERERLFDIIRELVKWDNVAGGKGATDPHIVEKARAEILRHTDGNPPPVQDPFCGGGSIPLEAQRLGLEARASDLNPVAVLITKALIEIPTKFANRPPVHPVAGQQRMARAWQGAQGLAEDVRYYGAWMRERAQERIGHLYPKAKLPADYGGGEATVIAWLWTRTVTCPNPACGARMPLVRSFALSTKKGKETWVEPAIDHAARTVRFTVRTGAGTPPEGTVGRQGARCIVCGTPAPLDHVRAEGRAGRMSAQLMAIVAEGRGGRLYLAPDIEHEQVARSAQPEWKPDQLVTTPSHDVDRLPMYGMFTWGDAFTPRQLAALTTFSDLVGEAREQVLHDAVAAGMLNDGVGLDAGGGGARAYADAVATYLGLGSSRCADFWSTIATWSSQAKNELVVPTFRRQAIPMTWDYGETNPFSDSSGNFLGNITVNSKVIEFFPAGRGAIAQQHDAAVAQMSSAQAIVSTDPPTTTILVTPICRTFSTFGSVAH